jgi:ABC-type multidrug transport system ATPase subunit
VLTPLLLFGTFLSVFFSSHNLAEVENVCHRVAIIRDGRIIACETLDALKRKRLRRIKITLRVPGGFDAALVRPKEP